MVVDVGRVREQSVADIEAAAFGAMMGAILGNAIGAYLQARHAAAAYIPLAIHRQP